MNKKYIAILILTITTATIHAADVTTIGEANVRLKRLAEEITSLNTNNPQLTTDIEALKSGTVALQKSVTSDIQKLQQSEGKSNEAAEAQFIAAVNVLSKELNELKREQTKVLNQLATTDKEINELQSEMKAMSSKKK